jgi:dephospho-CoA kinase
MNQLPASERRLHADDVIENTLPVEKLKQVVASLHQQYLQFARVY